MKKSLAGLFICVFITMWFTTSQAGRDTQYRTQIGAGNTQPALVVSATGGFVGVNIGYNSHHRGGYKHYYHKSYPKYRHYKKHYGYKHKHYRNHYKYNRHYHKYDRHHYKHYKPYKRHYRPHNYFNRYDRGYYSDCHYVKKYYYKHGQRYVAKKKVCNYGS